MFERLKGFCGRGADDSRAFVRGIAAITALCTMLMLMLVPPSSTFAIESNEASTPVDFTQYITHATISKLNSNGNWESTNKVTDGDSIRVSIDYRMPAGAVTSTNQQITYQLPDGVRPKQQESGTVYQHNTAVGTYNIGTDGKISITFNDEFVTGEAFSGSITFQGTAEKQGDGDSSKINFGGDSNTVTIEKKAEQEDLSVKKTATKSTGADGKTVITYKVVASSVNGTGEHTVTLKDQLKSITGSASYDKNSIKVVKVDAEGMSTEVQDVTVKNAEENNLPGFSIADLPALGKGEQYVLTYDVIVNGTAEDGSSSVQNAGGADSGNNHPWDWHTETVSNPVIQKSGYYNPDTDTITWTITVNNSCTTENNVKKCADLNGKKVTDMLPGDISVVPGSTVIVKGDRQQVGEPLSAQGFINSGYTFPAGSTASVYTFELQTTTPKGADGSTTTVTNSATFGGDGGGSGITTGGEVQVTKRGWGVSKTHGNETEREDGKTASNWTAAVTIPSSWKTFTFTDTVKNAVDKTTGEDQGDGSHYALASELQSDIETNLTMALSDGSKLDYEQLCKQFDITITYADADGKTVDAANSVAKVKKFTITVAPKAGNVDDAGNAIVTNSKGEKVEAARLTLNYSTIVDYSRLKAGDTWTIANKAQVGNRTSDATYDHTKDKPLEKMVGTVDGNGNVSYVDHSGNTKVDYDKTNGMLYYQLIVRTDKTTKGTITVTDTLPKGATLVTDGDHAPTAKFYGNDHWVYDSVGNYKIADHFEEVAGTPAEDGTTPVTFTIKDGYNNDGQAHVIAIRYAVSIKDDDFWNDLSHTTNNYTNKAEWESNSDETHTEVDRTVEDVKKAGEQVKDADGKPTNQVRYTIAINPAAKNLDPYADMLTLTDTMSGIPSDGSAYIDANTLDLYEYNTNADGKLNPTTKIDTSRYTVKYDTVSHTLTVQVPDQLACILVYTYTVDAGSAESPTLSNKVNLNGKTSSSTQTKIVTLSSSATVHRGKFTLYKVDGTNYNKLLAGATFTVYAYDTGTKWSNGVTATTESDGSITFDIAATTNTEFACSAGDGTTPPNCTLKPNTLYKIEETKAPDGYAKDTAAKYLIWKGKGTDDKVLTDDAAYQAATGVSGAITDGDARVERKNVTFYNANGSNSMFVENEYNRLAVKKTWVNAAGNAIDAPVDVIRVQLMQQKTKRDGHTVTVTFKQTDGTNTKDVTSQYVKSGSDVSLHIAGGSWGDNSTLTYNGTSYSVSAGQVTIPLEDITGPITVEVSNWWWFVAYGPSTTFEAPDAPYVGNGDPVKYGNPVTLDNDHNWSHYWDGLPKRDEDGNPYLYTITELGNNYDVTYTNNDGIQTGEIGITNKVTSISLPATGGIGTEPIVGGGLLLTTIAVGGLALSLKRRRL